MKADPAAFHKLARIAEMMSEGAAWEVFAVGIEDPFCLSLKGKFMSPALLHEHRSLIHSEQPAPLRSVLC